MTVSLVHIVYAAWDSTYFVVKWWKYEVRTLLWQSLMVCTHTHEVNRIWSARDTTVVTLVSYVAHVGISLMKECGISLLISRQWRCCQYSHLSVWWLHEYSPSYYPISQCKFYIFLIIVLTLQLISYIHQFRL